MAWDGFLKDMHCKRCGVKLQGQGDGRPAESYAGTYTGLCYKCEKAPVIVLHTYPLDGCKLKEYAPHSPSWRRDRESYHAYDDCPDCKGKGHNIISRSFAQGGSYPSYCTTCFNRFWDHPRRKSRSDEIEEQAGNELAMCYNELFCKELVAHGYKGHYTTKTKIGKRQMRTTSHPDGKKWYEDPDCKGIGEKWLAIYEQHRDAIRACIDNRYPDVVADMYRRSDHNVEKAQVEAEATVKRSEDRATN